MSAHSLATALIPFEPKPELIRDVKNAIKTWNNAPVPPAPTVKARLDGTHLIHFASVSTAEIPGGKAYLIIELTADVPSDEALQLFAGLLEAEIRNLLLMAGIPPPDSLDDWLLSRSVRIGQSPFVTCGLLFDGSPEMTVVRIHNEQKLVSKIEDNPDWLKGGGSLAQKLAALREKLWPDGALKPGFVPQPTPFLDPAPSDKTWLDRLRLNAIIAYRVLVWPLPLLPALCLIFSLLPDHGGWLAHLLWPLLDSGLVLAAALGVLTAAVRWHELYDIVTYEQQSKQDAEEILELENKTSQNILATQSQLKPGLARRLTLQLVFYAIRTVLPLYWAPGRLGDLNDIHFMRWLLLPGSNQLVFRSHYDGSWVNYIEDFALRAPQGVSAIWSNTKGFPPTQWLTQGGAALGPRFRQFVHTQTRPVFFNYSAYPDLSMERIRLHARIARAIATGSVDDGVKGWLASLGDADGGDF